ncbi:fibroblast growth factor 2 [Labeo rohita]|uniref:Fibroblast growth factor n=1 Tax=Labeo rohita TaxID=84645 RepID=A0A498MDF2_LABRO|nr:fibroblast growth factor 2 [Labeo rohita]
MPRGAETEKPKEREMAAGGITTLPASPDDGASGGFTPGNFKEPKRLYCKNGGYFLRIHPDGRVDGIREKSDPHIRLQLQATAVGEVVIKGICANRYLAMNADGRLFGTARSSQRHGPKSHRYALRSNFPKYTIIPLDSLKQGSRVGLKSSPICTIRS